MLSMTQRILAGSALALALGSAGAASAQQPLNIVVQPVTAVIQAPFQIVGGILGGPPVASRPAAVFNGRAARRHAVGYTADGTPIIRARSLRATGPRYVNPPNADWERPLVLSEGAVVPNRVPLVPVVNANVPGLVPNARYNAFVSPVRNRIVFVDPVTLQVARVIRR